VCQRRPDISFLVLQELRKDEPGHCRIAGELWDARSGSRPKANLDTSLMHTWWRPYTIHPSSRALSLASRQAFPTNAACEIGDR